jgi:hypothetical protein
MLDQNKILHFNQFENKCKLQESKDETSYHI